MKASVPFPPSHDLPTAIARQVPLSPPQHGWQERSPLSSRTGTSKLLGSACFASWLSQLTGKRGLLLVYDLEDVRYSYNKAVAQTA